MQISDIKTMDRDSVWNSLCIKSQYEGDKMNKAVRGILPSLNLNCSIAWIRFSASIHVSLSNIITCNN